MFRLDSLASGATLLALWRRLSPLPGGKLIVSRLIGQLAPYTGTIGARIEHLEPGSARVSMRDRRAVRNHLDSVHAVALVNLAEEATGLALMAGLPATGRGILKGISIEYLKKARGTLTAECTCGVPATSERQDIEIEGLIRNADGEVVARARAHWLVGPKKGAREAVGASA